MELNDKGLREAKDFTEKGYIIADYNRGEMINRTIDNPEWIHFGSGNIFRAYMCNLSDKMLEQGLTQTGIIAVGGRDEEVNNKVFKRHNNLFVLATLKASGDIEKKIVKSIAQIVDCNFVKEWNVDRLREIFRSDSLKMVSLTITEKGYLLKDGNGVWTEDYDFDLHSRIKNHAPKGYLTKLLFLLYERFCAGAKPITLVSMDNCSHNGEKLSEALIEIATAIHYRYSTFEDEFFDYLKDPSKVAFPCTMIDKITPRPDPSIASMLKEDGLVEMEPVVSSSGTYTAPFVNAEEAEYLVIEDWFTNGKLPLDKVGVIYTDKATVEKVERMKVCTCLNPLHTALAVFGCLLGFNTIHDEMEDEDLRNLVTTLAYKEMMPAVSDPGVMDPKEFLDTVLNKRLTNPFLPDTPFRIATDTSQKLPIRFGETIKTYRSSKNLKTKELTLIPLVLAGWVRYLYGLDDNGECFDPSPDPKLSELMELDGEEILHRKEYFGCDLFEDELGKKTLEIYNELIEGKGEVRKTLHKYVTQAMK